MAHRMECFRKAVIAGDTSHDGVVYICLFYTRQWLFIRFYLFQSHRILVPLHPRLYIASFVLQVYVVQTWEFFLRAGVREYACSGLYSLLALALGRPNHYLRRLYALICVCDVCIRVCKHYTSVFTAFAIENQATKDRLNASPRFLIWDKLAIQSTVQQARRLQLRLTTAARFY